MEGPEMRASVGLKETIVIPEELAGYLSALDGERTRTKIENNPRGIEAAQLLKNLAGKNPESFRHLLAAFAKLDCGLAHIAIYANEELISNINTLLSLEIKTDRNTSEDPNAKALAEKIAHFVNTEYQK